MKHPKNNEEQLFDPMLCPCQECRKIRKIAKEVEKLMKAINREIDRKSKHAAEAQNQHPLPRPSES